jgi:hypothetical protein
VLTLNICFPLGEVTLVDSLEEILGGVVGSLTSKLGSLLLSQKLNTLLGEQMELGINPFALLVGELEGVSRVSLHLSVSIGDTTISEEPHNLVNRLRVVGKVVPEHGGVGTTVKMCLRISLLSMDEVRELRWIAEEEDGG